MDIKSNNKTARINIIPSDNDSPIKSVAFSPDGKAIVAGLDNNFVVLQKLTLA